MSRLSMMREHDKQQVLDETQVALETTIKTGFGGNHCLCHGDLGNLELLLQASRTLGDSRWNSEANGVVRGVLNRIAADGWLCGIPLRAESPGLMTGLAGIGYGLLRFAAPERVPSVLMLEPPTMSASRIPAADRRNGSASPT
jgi:lantibiotic modifying enzyme